MSENMIVWLLLAVVLAISLGPLVWSHFRNASVLAGGTSASANVVEVIDTRRRHNDDPVLRIHLLVSGPAQETFAAEVSTAVSVVLLHRFTPGSTVPVKFDPKDRQRVAIDFERLTVLSQ